MAHSAVKGKLISVIGDEDQCDVGLQIEDLCHKPTFTKRKRMVSTESLKEEDQEKLRLRAGVSSCKRVCQHHLATFSDGVYESRQRRCCDPFQLHQKPRRKCLRIATYNKIRSAKTLHQIDIIPGQKLCTDCSKSVLKPNSAATEGTLMSTRSSTPDLDMTTEVESDTELSSNLLPQPDETFLNFSPVNTKRFSTKSKASNGKRKLTQSTAPLNLKLGASLKMQPTLCDDSDKSFEQCMLSDLKLKLKSCTKNEQVQILTLIPDFWSAQKISAEFGVSMQIANKSKQVRKEEGVLPKLNPRWQ